MVRKQMKKSLLTAAVLLMVLVCFCAQAAQSFPFTTVTTVSVNMRRTASGNGVVLERLKEGEQVTVLGESGGYYKVSYDGRTGYILKSYLSSDASVVTTPAPTEQPTASSYPYETVSTEKVNLRQKASKSSEILGRIPKGDTVTVQSISSSWAKVTWKELEGYVQKDYLVIKKIVRATATPKATATASVNIDLSGNANAYTLLMPGAAGQEVYAMQQALKELGFYSGTLSGSYDAETEKAVLAFQKKNKYPETGIMDPNIMAFLFSGKPLNSKGTATQVTVLAPIEGVTVRPGNRGELVSRIQVRLYSLGYYKGEITSVYDAATRNAVKAFQKANGLTADALAGAETQQLLFSEAALAVGVTAAPTATPTPTPAPALETPSATVQQGTSGHNAQLVQQRLITLGYLTGKADGNFGSASVQALKAFQKAHGLKDDGKAGTETLALLFSYDALPAGATPTPAPSATPSPAPVPTATPTPEPVTAENVTTIRLGSTGDAVRRLQERLTELGYYQATVDGVCKADDAAAIRTFQSLNRLKEDGVAGLDTQQVLYSDKAVPFTGVTAQNTVPTGTMRLGDTGDNVKALQERLIALKYLFGKADGVFGTATEEALTAFQKASGLKADGVAGESTLEKLFSSSAVKASDRAAATATPSPAASTLLQRGDKSAEVKRLQQRLIELGYLSGKADGSFGVDTYNALVAFQKANRLKADGVAGSETLAVLESSSAVSASASAKPAATATPKPTALPAVNLTGSPSASSVKYANWYSIVKSVVSKYPYATIYDFKSGISWQVHIFSTGAHADAEPLTATDTARMVKAFGGNTWTPKAVWVVLSNGQVYMASTHSMPHEVQHITDNDFAGHLCIHFPRTEEQVEAIGPYATSHQTAIDEGWEATQKLAGK